jgi:hypothetical protein
MKLLLANPRLPESFWSFRWAVPEILPARKVLNPPLGLATLAALCPPIGASRSSAGMSRRCRSHPTPT